MGEVIFHQGEYITSLEFTEAAESHILNFLMVHPEYKGILFFVEKTGCSGLSYEVSYLTEVDTQDIPVFLDDKPVVYIKKKSFPYLRGSRVDYVKQGLNHKFVFTNPNQTGECGCGKSFTVD